MRISDWSSDVCSSDLQFAKLTLLQALPDETTILNFRRLLERDGLAADLFNTINAHLSAHGLLLRQGTMVDATIIHAPSSTKNREHARDPETHQTKKGNQWYFGMKAHIGVDTDPGLVHTVRSDERSVGQERVSTCRSRWGRAL